VVSKSFDGALGDFPEGYKHDISLVKPDQSRDIADVKSPIPNLTWLSKEGWKTLRKGEVEVKYLGEFDIQAKSINTSTWQDCLVSSQ
jgi:hypothetical protein